MPDFAGSASDALHRILDPDSIDYVFSQQKKKKKMVILRVVLWNEEEKTHKIVQKLTD